MVLKEWAAEKRIHNNPIYLDLPLELERELLAELAFNSFVDDQLFFDKRDVTDRIKGFLVSNLNAPKHLDSEAVLEAIEVQQGILTERARDAYSFSHLTFQEHLTAQRIIDMGKVGWLVENHLTDERWREVFMLVAGLLRGAGADALLQLMETKLIDFLQAQELNALDALIQWAESSIAHSKNPASPAAKRAAVIAFSFYFASDIGVDGDIALNTGLVRTFARTLDIDIASNLASILAISLTLALARARVKARVKARASNIVRANNIAKVIAREIQDIQLFEHFSHEKLSEDLNRLEHRAENENMSEQQIVDALLGVWSDALQFDLKQLSSLAEDKAEVLKQYIYASRLIIQCKDAAVRVSPQVWQGIEERLLTVPKDAKL